MKSRIREAIKNAREANEKLLASFSMMLDEIEDSLKPESREPKWNVGDWFVAHKPERNNTLTWDERMNDLSNIPLQFIGMTDGGNIKAASTTWVFHPDWCEIMKEYEKVCTNCGNTTRSCTEYSCRNSSKWMPKPAITVRDCRNCGNRSNPSCGLTNVCCNYNLWQPALGKLMQIKKMKNEIEVSERLMVFLMSKGILEQFGYNCRHETEFNHVDIYDDIWNAFEFDRTTEGYDFWARHAADFKFI